MRLKISHTTRYQFEEPVIHGLQQLRKTPKSGRAQKVLNWVTTVQGGTKELAFEDFLHNTVELLSISRGTTEFVVRSEGEVEMTDTHGIVGPHAGPAPLWLFRNPSRRTVAGAGCRGLVRRASGDSTLDQLHALSSLIREEVAYETGASHVGWTAEDVLADGRGVCQDHAHVFIACARAMGHPARYVSGYLMMEDRVDQEATHAWAEAHIDGLGWVGFDVSNGISPDTRYVRVATGLDYTEAAPITGTMQGGGGESLDVQVSVAQQ